MPTKHQACSSRVSPAFAEINFYHIIWIVFYFGPHVIGLSFAFFTQREKFLFRSFGKEMEYDKYYQLLTIKHEQKTIKLKVFPSSKGEDISNTIKDHFGLPRECAIVLVDDAGCDCVIDGYLETTAYTLHVMGGIGATSSVSSSDSKLQWPAARVRQTFLDYFAKQKHTFVPSSPVVPENDPTLFFINAGMNQFKGVFLGEVDPNSDMGRLKRAHNSQKCIRAGGKHNDLDDVGKDVYHHTFFEMLGNWSFGDYFKVEAIDFAWELLTKVFGIEPSRLYATYFGGTPSVPADEEAKKLWLRFLPADRILPFGMKDNFWEMGDDGPCGPCTEIHYDRIGGRNVAHLVNKDDPDVLEIWNLVFMQYNREKGTGELRPLKPSVDTGMGFERLTSVLQNKRSNYDTDIFSPLFKAIQAETKAAPYGGLVGAADKDLRDMAYRVVADHLRTITFALTDGAHIEAQNRGYVLRRIIRRAVRYGKEFLGAQPGFLSRLVPVVVTTFGTAFPELIPKQQAVAAEVAAEEALFDKTLDSGLKQFKKITAGRKSGEQINGDEAALLFHTYGFPIDLTELMAEEKHLKVDKAGFEQEMEEHKDKSKGKVDSEAKTVIFDSAEEPAHLAQQKVQITDDSAKYSWDSVQGSGPVCHGQVKAIYAGSHNWLTTVQPGQLVSVILDKTNFYAESGGQVNDTGKLVGKKCTFEVLDCQVKAKYILHVGRVAKGSLKVGDKLQCEPDYARRAIIAKNHTCTHILNLALRKTVGDTKQEGSLVDTEKLRFDFAHNGGLSQRHLEAITLDVKQSIAMKQMVHTQERDKEEATKLSTLRFDSLKGYGDSVRVVSVGLPLNQAFSSPNDSKWFNYSVELCGGTHIQNSGEIEDFCIISEEGISKGTRRIVGLTYDKARQARSDALALRQKLQTALTLDEPQAIRTALSTLKEEEAAAVLPVEERVLVKGLLKELSDKDLACKKAAGANAETAAVQEATTEGKKAKAAGAKHKVMFLPDAQGNNKALQKALDAFTKEAPDTAIFIFSSERKDGGKGCCMVVVPGNKSAALPANVWMNTALAVAGGKGGGKANKATGAVRDCSGTVSLLLDTAEQFVKGKL
eukprot:g37327.t1